MPLSYLLDSVFSPLFCTSYGLSSWALHSASWYLCFLWSSNFWTQFPFISQLWGSILGMSGQNYLDFSKYLIMKKEEKMKRVQSLFPMFIRTTVSGTFLSVWWTKNPLTPSKMTVSIHPLCLFFQYSWNTPTLWIIPLPDRKKTPNDSGGMSMNPSLEVGREGCGGSLNWKEKKSA